MAKPTRVVFLQRRIAPYRVPFYMKLGSYSDIDLRVVQSRGASGEDAPTYDVQPAPMTKVGRFRYQHVPDSELHRAEVIVAPFDVHDLHVLKLLVTKPRSPILLWGIGAGSRRSAMPLRAWMASRADAVVFYAERPREMFLRHGLDPSRLYVANNTVHVSEPRWNSNAEQRKDFVFVGRLDARKGVDTLIEAFTKAAAEMDPSVRLRIVGDGPQGAHLRALAASSPVGGRIEFVGPVHDEKRLADILWTALACVSPGQAGLSVLHSFAFGVPFITKYNAISGFEIDNVHHDDTGMLFDGTPQNLAAILTQLAHDPERATEMGRKAHLHYIMNRSMDSMVSAFHEAIVDCVTRSGRSAE